MWDWANLGTAGVETKLFPRGFPSSDKPGHQAPTLQRENQMSLPTFVSSWCFERKETVEKWNSYLRQKPFLTNPNHCHGLNIRMSPSRNARKPLVSTGLSLLLVRKLEDTHHLLPNCSWWAPGVAGWIPSDSVINWSIWKGWSMVKLCIFPLWPEIQSGNVKDIRSTGAVDCIFCLIKYLAEKNRDRLWNPGSNLERMTQIQETYSRSIQISKILTMHLGTARVQSPRPKGWPSHVQLIRIKLFG